MPSAADLRDALEHADSYGTVGFKLSDFATEYLGDLSVAQLGQYDDLSSWMDVDPADFKGLPKSQRLAMLEDFRGPAWASRAKRWLTEGIPPIVIVTTPDPDGEWERVITQIGDGRGRVNFAAAMGMRIPTWLLTYRG